MGENPDVLLDRIRTAKSLLEVATVLGTSSIHEAYFRAKDVWADAIGRAQAAEPVPTGLPGRCVTVDGHDFHIHGVTHADTQPERDLLREHVNEFLDRDASVYCEQGIRAMYFEDFTRVCEMDDYRWAMAKCQEYGFDSHLRDSRDSAVDGIREDVASVADIFREATFALIESGGSIYGARFEQALGDVAAGFMTGEADHAVGKNYQAFTLSRAASENPERLIELQHYYERTFLPQPLEREWLRRHDPELEIVSHARNERMVEYVLFHNESIEEIHLIVGAAHLPGLVYYLEHPPDEEALADSFELF